MITQASSEHSICIGVKEEDSAIAKAIDNNDFEISLNAAPAKIEKNMVNIAVVLKMKDHQG